MEKIKKNTSYLLNLDVELKNKGMKQAKKNRKSFAQYILSLIEKDLEEKRRQ